MNVFEVLGWSGAALVLVGYVSVTRSGTSALYHSVNLVGSTGLLVNALHHRALPPTVLSFVWCLIAVWGMAAMARKRRNR